MADSPGASRPAALRLALKSDFNEVRRAAQEVGSFFAEQGIGAAEINACNLALVEACNNAIKYARATPVQQPVIVDALCDRETLELRITDHTPGFAWPSCAQLPGEESETGRGIYLMQTLMTRTSYLRGQDRNVLVLQKTRATPVAGMGDPPFDAAACRRQLAENERVIGEMVDELSSCYESLSAIFRYSAAETHPHDLGTFARQLLGDLLHIIGADWFVLRIAPQDHARLVVLAASDALLELDPLPLQPRNGRAAGVEVEAVLARREVWFDESRPLDPADPLGQARPGALGLVHPFFMGETLIGTLAVGKSAKPRPAASGQSRLTFTASQTNVVGTFAEFLSIQIVNARFQDELVRNRLVAHELSIAKNIQQLLLLKTLPELPGFTLAAHCESAHQVGGDFYDVIKADDHSTLLVIADVMGKGVPAAMFAAILRTMLRAAPELAHQPAALLTRVNRLLFEELSGVDMFITAQLAYVDATARRLVTASAGHCPLLFAADASSPAQAISPDGMPLGIMEESAFAETALDLPAGCRLLLFTDGLTEALDAEGHRFGQERLGAWLQHTSALSSAGDLKRALALEFEKFHTGSVLSDDQTFLIMVS